MFKVPFIIYAVSFIDLLAVGLFVPLLPQHIRSLGASYTTIGLLSAVYSALQVFAGPVIGSWSDIRGRKYVAFRTLFVCNICYILIGFTTSIPLLFIIRFILGLVKHTQTLLKAIVADCCPRQKHAEILGFSSAIGSLGFVVGPVIGGHLSELQNGFQYVSLLTSVLFLINIIFIYGMNIPDKSNTIGSINIKRDLLKAITDLGKINWAIYWDTFLLRFLFGFAVSVYFANQSLYLQSKFDLSQKSIGYLISFVSIIASGSGLALGFITSKFYYNDSSCFQRLFHGFLMLSVTFLALYFAPNVYFLIVVLVPFGVANAVLRNVSMEAILARCDSNERGSLAGAVSSIMSVSRFVSPISSGIVGDLYGEQNIISLAFLSSVLGTFLCTHLFHKRTDLNRSTIKLS